MGKARQRKAIPRYRKRASRSGRLVQQPALLSASPVLSTVDNLNGAPHRLVGEARIQRMLVIGLCAAFSLIGLLLIVQGGARIREARQVEGWATTQGVVETADVYSGGGSQGEQWRPRVRYSYMVNSRLIYSTSITLGKPLLEDTQAQALSRLERYPVGSSVTVHYDPAEITQSVLETDTPASAYANLLFGCALALMGPALLTMFRRSAAERRHWPIGSDPAVSSS